MRNVMAQIVILGSGLTGLSVAYHLEKNNFYDYVLYEKEDTPGGLCRSIQQDGFIFDYTGHLLHVNDEYFRTFLEDIIGLHHFNAIHRRSFIYSHDTYTPYPYQMNLHGLPHEVIAECIEGFVTKPLLQKKYPSFLEWTTAHFGTGITKHFFKPYQEKIFACDLNDITASWTGRFVPSTTLRDIISGSLSGPLPTPVGYNAQFFYPKEGGIFRWVHALSQRLRNKIKTNSCVESVDSKNKIITFTNGDFDTYTTLVSTIPLDNFLQILKEPSSSHLYTASKKLRCNSVLNFNLGINKLNLSDKHWIYFPEKKFPHYRLGFYHNLSPAMVPEGCSSLYGEIAYFPEQEKFLSQKITQALQMTQKLLNFSQHDIITQKIIHIKHAYVTYDFWRERSLEKLHKKLHSYSLHSIGRYGGWKYSSMQESVLEGKIVAEELIKQCNVSMVYQKKEEHIG